MHVTGTHPRRFGRSILVAASLALCLATDASAEIRRVAVLAFEGAQQDLATAWLATAPAVSLEHKLHGIRGLHLVERRRLDRVLEEQRFSLSDLVDPHKAAKVGALLVADQLVLGTYFVFGTSVRFTARFVDVTTGTVVKTAQVTGVLDKRNPDLLWAAIDKLALALVDSLNEQTVAAGRTERIALGPDDLRRVASVPTKSLDAYRWYVTALAKYDKVRRVCDELGPGYKPSSVERLYELQRLDWGEEEFLRAHLEDPRFADPLVKYVFEPDCVQRDVSPTGAGWVAGVVEREQWQREMLARLHRLLVSAYEKDRDDRVVMNLATFYFAFTETRLVRAAALCDELLRGFGESVLAQSARELRSRITEKLRESRFKKDLGFDELLAAGAKGTMEVSWEELRILAPDDRRLLDLAFQIGVAAVAALNDREQAETKGFDFRAAHQFRWTSMHAVAFAGITEPFQIMQRADFRDPRPYLYLGRLAELIDDAPDMAEALYEHGLRFARPGHRDVPTLKFALKRLRASKLRERRWIVEVGRSRSLSEAWGTVRRLDERVLTPRRGGVPVGAFYVKELAQGDRRFSVRYAKTFSREDRAKKVADHLRQNFGLEGHVLSLRGLAQPTSRGPAGVGSRSSYGGNLGSREDR